MKILGIDPGLDRTGWALLERRPPDISPYEAYVQSVSPFASVHLAAHR